MFGLLQNSDDVLGLWMTLYSAVLRSQSFHSGVAQFNNLQLRQQFSEDSFNKNHWTVTSTESSDEEEFGDHA